MGTFAAGGDDARSGFEVSEQVNAGAQHDAPFAFLLFVKGDGRGKGSVLSPDQTIPPAVWRGANRVGQ